MHRTDAINLSIIISNISPWAYIRGGLYSNGFFVNKSLGLYSRGLIIEGAYTRDFTVLHRRITSSDIVDKNFNSYRRCKHKNLVSQAKKYIKYLLELLRAIFPIYINGFRRYLMYMALVYIRYSAQFTFYNTVAIPLILFIVFASFVFRKN